MGLSMRYGLVVAVREYLADPTMQLVDDPLESRSNRKLWTAREGAAGGDAEPAGGGCGCSNAAPRLAHARGVPRRRIDW